MIIRSSHLALRFYAHDGWTESLAQQYVNGSIRRREGLGKGQHYWTPNTTAHINMDKITPEIAAGRIIIQDFKGEILSPKFAIKYVEESS